MQRVDVEQDFSVPVGRLYAYLSEHEHLEEVLGAKITRVRDGDTSRNGPGSVRRLRIAVLPPFEETITAAVPDERIEYRITKGSPLRDHHGTMTFTPRGTGSHLRWVIDFGAAVPGLDVVVKQLLQRVVPRGLRSIDVKA